MRGYIIAENKMIQEMKIEVDNCYYFENNFFPLDPRQVFYKNIDDCLKKNEYKKGITNFFEVDTDRSKIIDNGDLLYTQKYYVVEKIPIIEYNNLFKNYIFDNQGNLVKIIHGKNWEEEKEFDSQGRLIRYKNKNGFEEIWRYDQDNNLIYYTDGYHFVTEKQYNKENKNTKIFENGLEVESWKYDENGNIIEHIYKKNKENFEYTTWGDLLSHTTKNGIERWEYDDYKRVIKHIFNDNYENIFYNAAEQKIKEINQKGLEKTWKYDTNGNCIEYNNGEGLIEKWEYNEIGQKTKYKKNNQDIEIWIYVNNLLVNYENKITKDIVNYIYDNDLLIEINDNKNHYERWNYKLGLLMQYSNHSGKIIKYTYDIDRNITNFENNEKIKYRIEKAGK